MRTLKLGTRRSPLALAQSRLVAADIQERARLSGRSVHLDLVEIVTEGDVSRASLSSLGGVGVFASALREAVLDGTVDLAVHSLKDLPTAPAPGLVLAAVPPREDPRDAFISRGGLALSELPPGALVGTGSPRRACQLLAVRPDLKVVDIRGNVDTRLAMVTDGHLDAIVLALSGLRRLGRQDVVASVLGMDLMLPAPGQGALAVECRDQDTDVLTLLSSYDDAQTRAAVLAERSFMATLEAGCSAPLGALAGPADPPSTSTLILRGCVGSLDGTRVLRQEALSRSGEDPTDLGRRLATDLLARGAAELMAPPAPETGPYPGMSFVDEPPDPPHGVQSAPGAPDSPYTSEAGEGDQ